MQEPITLAPGLAFLFDMDGVIVESTDIHEQAWSLYLERLGVDGAGLMQRMLGKRNDQIVHALFGADLPEADVIRHGADKEKLYRELMAPRLESSYVPGARDFIRAAARARISCAVATNAEAENVDFVLNGAALRPCFQALVDGGQVRHAKPHPEVYLTAAARLGIAPANCVVYEDSPGGMQAARAAGTHLVALLTTVAEAPLADLAIDNFLDPRLAPFLASLQPR